MIETVQNILPKSLEIVVSELKKSNSFKPSKVVDVLKRAKVQQEDLEKWADFNHPVQDCYGRKLVYDGGNFEIMVMSWRPGDFSAIHDHGYTQWGAVQVFGPAEHATFRLEDDKLNTLARWMMTPGDIVGVGHSLIHQMGNPTKDNFFLSLHIYGDTEELDNVTGDARIFDLFEETIQRVDGGVFYGLPKNEIKKIEAGAKGDFPTTLRHMVELSKRISEMENRDVNNSGLVFNEIIKKTFNKDQQQDLLSCLDDHTNNENHQTSSIFWRVLNRELKVAAEYQGRINKQTSTKDKFFKYADLYDELICKPSMDNFIANYFNFIIEKYQVKLENLDFISLGCGTGLIEEKIMEKFNVPYNNLYGIDISESMIDLAKTRIRADVGDVLQLDPSIKLWDMAFSGLNVFQYLDFNRLEDAIEKTAGILKPGGVFIGDFITPDHMRWYPNVMYSEDRNIVSLRTPVLIEDNGRIFQESEITNLSFNGDEMEIFYSGKHRRFLPPLNRIRQFFENHFKGGVDLYDAYSLEIIPEWADSCSSTRYIVFARKN